MMWWRVELDKAGAILKVEQVEAREKGTSRICFVEANSKAEACSEAKAWARAYSERYNCRGLNAAQLDAKRLRESREGHDRKNRERGGLLGNLQALKAFDRLGPHAYRAWLVERIQAYYAAHPEIKAKAAE